MASDDIFDDAFLKKLDYLYIVSQKIVAGSSRAERKTKLVGSGLEFADFRHYTHGDDLRNIDWKIYARSEKLFVKLFEEEEDLYIYFLVDCSRSMKIGDEKKWQYAKQIVAALGYIGLSNLDRVSIIPFSNKLEGRLPPARGKSQIFKIFKFLSGLEAGTETSLKDALKTFVTQNKRRGIAVVLSDFYDPSGFEDGLNFLRYHKFEPMVVHLYDERELSANFRGDLRLVDCETGEVAELTVTEGMMQSYKKAWEDMSQELQSYCSKRQMLYFRSSVQVPFDKLILKIFRAGGFIK